MNALLTPGDNSRRSVAAPLLQTAPSSLEANADKFSDRISAPVLQLPSPHSILKSRKGQRLWQIHKTDTDSSLRPHTEALIRDQYRAVHGAEITDFFPNLFMISDGVICLGVIGLSDLENRHGLVEQYLDDPIETALSKVTGHLTTRSRLIEVGNLAASNLDVATRLIAFLCHETHQFRYEYAVFTGIKSVRVALKRLGIHCLILQAADPAKLRADAAQWGRYYENDPHVMVVDVAQAAATIAATFDIERLA